MGKFTLYDFLSFVLPGGTFIGITIEIFKIPYPTITKTELFIIPFLVIAYLLGHLFSLLGRWMEHKFYKKVPLWMEYLKQNSLEADEINKLSCDKLKTESFINDNDELLHNESGKAYDHMYAFLEINDKDAKIKTLMAQYGFFRNITGVWLVLLITQIMLITLDCLHLIDLNKSIVWNSILVIAFILAGFSSLLLMRQRKSMAMKHVYRTFLVFSNQL